MKYEVIENFTDLQDKNHKYQAGDKFPREGYIASDKRIEELSTDENRRHRPMIKVVAETVAETVPEPVIEAVEPEPVSEVKTSKRGKKKKNVE